MDGMSDCTLSMSCIFRLSKSGKFLAISSYLISGYGLDCYYGAVMAKGATSKLGRSTGISN